jgi:deazaflavin-dependent oxidoreductase (nitroreductase family)
MSQAGARSGDHRADGAKDAVVRMVSTLHAAVYRATDGKALNRVLGMRVIELTTTGRRSGLPRSTMLTAPLVEPDRIVLVASNGGDDRDPQWYRNILARPRVSVIMDGRTRAMGARVATGPERLDLWGQIRSVTPTYDRYQSRTSRQLPVVVLEPSGSGAGPTGV